MVNSLCRILVRKSEESKKSFHFNSQVHGRVRDLFLNFLGLLHLIFVMFFLRYNVVLKGNVSPEPD